VRRLRLQPLREWWFRGAGVRERLFHGAGVQERWFHVGVWGRVGARRGMRPLQGGR
jgi:hypothetical protein